MKLPEVVQEFILIHNGALKSNVDWSRHNIYTLNHAEGAEIIHCLLMINELPKIDQHKTQLSVELMREFIDSHKHQFEAIITSMCSQWLAQDDSRNNKTECNRR